MRDAAAPLLPAAPRQQPARGNERTIRRQSHACAPAARDTAHRSKDSRHNVDNADTAADKAHDSQPEWIAVDLHERGFGGISAKPASLADNLYQHTLAPLAIELSVEDLFPGTEVKFAAGDGNDYFSSHDLPLDVRVRIVLAGVVVAILFERLVRSEFFQPDGVIIMQT